MEAFTAQYNIYMEAEDIGQSRIHKSTEFVKNLIQNCRSVYLISAVLDDESDLDEFALRLYIEHKIQEDACSSLQDAQDFIPDLAEFLDAIAAAHSFLDMEGSFSWEYKGEKAAYRFRTESGWDYCDFIEKEKEEEAMP